MRVALFQPFVSDLNITPPLGLLYLAALLERDGFETALFDEKTDKNAYSKAEAYKPDIFAVSAVTAAYKRGLDKAEIIKKAIPSVSIVFGGPHPSSLPESVAMEPVVDYVIIGEGEAAFISLCKLLRDVKDPHECRGELINVAFRDMHGKVYVSNKAELLTDDELDRLPYPAFHLMDLEMYFSSTQLHGLYQRGKRILPIMTSRGCSYTCTYCCRVMGNVVRKRSIDSVIYEIRYLIDTYDIDELYIEDDNFLFDKERALTLLGKIRETGIKYLKLANGASVNMIDEDILKELKKSNVYSISFGIESGSKSTLSKMNKHIDLDRARRIISFAKSIGLLVWSNCIIGYPGETVGDIKESLEYFFSLGLDSMAIINLIPFPGTEVRRICEESGYLTAEAGDWNNYYFSINDPIPLIETPQLTREQLVLEIKTAYRKMYLNLPWILKAVRGMSLKNILMGMKVYFGLGRRAQQ